jgi:molybdate transport system ATP-binding protein
MLGITTSLTTRSNWPPETTFSRRSEADVGARDRVQIAARDVSIATRRPADLSILNVLEARITVIVGARGEPALLLVQLDVAGEPLLARITRKAAHALALEPGQHVWALVRNVAILP